jgi:3-isopropylmalate/(R)-2-methylmalate dehydratase small subunit
MQIGVRAILGTSFAGIFFDNCARNGLLAISLPEPALEILLMKGLEAGTSEITVDLETCRITAADGPDMTFEIETSRREALLKGWDAVSRTLAFADDIRAFERRHQATNPWLF